MKVNVKVCFTLAETVTKASLNVNLPWRLFFLKDYLKLHFSLGDQFAVCSPAPCPLSFHRAKQEWPSLNRGILVEMNSYRKIWHSSALTDSIQVQFNTIENGNMFTAFLRRYRSPFLLSKVNTFSVCPVT